MFRRFCLAEAVTEEYNLQQCLDPQYAEEKEWSLKEILKKLDYIK